MKRGIDVNRKIKLNPTIKLVLTILFIVGIGILSVQAIKEKQNIQMKQEEKIKYQYTYGTDINYAANLIPNILYEVEKIYENETYISEFIKSINVNFRMKFEGSDSTQIKGNYEIIAQMAGYSTQKEEKMDLWTKNFMLVPQTNFEEKDICEIQKLVVMDYHTYNDLAKAIMEVSKVNVPVELRVMMKGEIKGENDYETIIKPIDTNLVIPLGTPYFNITKVGVGETTDSIKEVVETPIPPNTKLVGFYIGGIGILIVLIIVIWVFTTQPDELDIRRKRISKILNNHSSRLVGVGEVLDKNANERYEVQNIDDLIKIADELEKPIIYQYNRDILKINALYVMDKDIRYSYKLGKELVNEPIVWKLPKEETNEESC